MRDEIIFTVLSDLLFILLLFGGAYLFSILFYKAYKGEAIWSKKGKCFGRIETYIYKFINIDPNENMGVKKYTLSLLGFSLVSFIGLYLILLFQNAFLFNPNGYEGLSWHLAYNTAASFVSNTNWQSYSGETALSYFSQMMGLTVQNFVSGAVGIAVLFALFRGFTNKEDKRLGNFWVDLTKVTIYVMLPICFVGALLLVSQGVIQNFNGSISYQTLNNYTSTLYMGPGASQIIIKQLFTNGGGFFGTNSCYPYENPTPLSNLVETLSLIWIPVSLCIVFGKAVKDKKQGSAILKAMTIFFVVCLAITTASEFIMFTKIDFINYIGNMEGKESRFAIGASALWAVATTCASNGSVNAMMDSFTPIGGMIPMFLMMLGEVVYGGVGCGLYGMIAFAIMTVFIAGLMVGRTPEYIGKKINPFDMKMVCLVILPPVLCILLGTAATCLIPYVDEWINATNSGTAHAFSEILYTFVSQSANNGSAFAGFNANTPWTNMTGGTIMLFVRFLPMVAVLYLASSLGGKKITPVSDGTLSTNNTMFVLLLVFVVLIIGALSFLPALAMGPLAEALSNIVLI